jgi:hypothetical protein
VGVFGWCWGWWWGWGGGQEEGAEGARYGGASAEDDEELVVAEGEALGEGAGVVVWAEVEAHAEVLADTSEHADVSEVADGGGDDGTGGVLNVVQLDDEVAQRVHAPVESAEVEDTGVGLGFGVWLVSYAAAGAAEEEVQDHVEGNKEMHG